MESAFTGLVRKHRAPFKKKKKRKLAELLQSHYSIITDFAGSCVYFAATLLPRLSPSLSLSLCVSHTRLSLQLGRCSCSASAMGIKEWQSEGSLTRTNQPSDWETEGEERRGGVVERVKHGSERDSRKMIRGTGGRTRGQKRPTLAGKTWFL